GLAEDTAEPAARRLREILEAGRITGEAWRGMITDARLPMDRSVVPESGLPKVPGRRRGPAGSDLFTPHRRSAVREWGEWLDAMVAESEPLLDPGSTAPAAVLMVAWNMLADAVTRMRTMLDRAGPPITEAERAEAEERLRLAALRVAVLRSGEGRQR